MSVKMKPELKTVKRTILEVRWHELEKFVKKVYGVTAYNFVACEECDNDSVSKFNVEGVIEKYEEKEAERIRYGGSPKVSQNSLVLNMLCADGYIEEGEYLVGVCW